MPVFSRPWGLPAAVLAGAVALALAATPTHAVIDNVDEAEDICPTEDPCTIDELVNVLDGSVLDFGTRTVGVVAGGQIDIGAGTVTLRCGRFSTSLGASAAIKARASDGAGGMDGGVFTLEADSILMDARVRAQGDTPGVITLRAGGDIEIGELIDAHSTDGDSDGGVIEVESIDGSVTMDGQLDVGAGRFSEGGAITIVAGQDIDVAGALLAEGGEFDGGAIVLDAAGSVTVTGNVSATAPVEDGSGGEISVNAGVELALEGSATVTANGHRSSEDFAGDGGDISFESGGDLVVGANVIIESIGARPDGSGGAVSLVADGLLNFIGRSTAVSRGADGTGGDHSLEGCEVRHAGNSSIDSSGDRGTNRISARETLVLLSGSTVLAGPGSNANRFEYRKATVPPVISGEVDPAPLLVVDADLEPCPTCGNSAIEDGETCDDGNDVGGDGCSDDCNDEGCIADTPGYPVVKLCDDRKVCTADRCDTVASACEHEVACDDGVFCTVDSCGRSGNCLHAPDDALCDDGNECTDDSCGALECSNVEHGDPCDDGLDCTIDDVCGGGFCAGTPDCPPGETCSAITGQCERPPPTTTTTTTLSSCGNNMVEIPEECDDGDLLWDTGEACRADCSLVACGDPDDSGSVTASDSLVALRAAVGASSCDPCVCDVDATGGPPNTTDALRLLKVAVQIPLELSCPPCP